VAARCSSRLARKYSRGGQIRAAIAADSCDDASDRRRAGALRAARSAR
jgi:hypothetical protein